MKIVMMGIQGSGKGTISKLLSKSKGLPHISVGDLFRDNIRRGTQLGREAETFTSEGKLVPDTVVIGMVHDRLRQPDAASGFILDGFPRNGVQLAAMEHVVPADHAVLLELDRETAIQRIMARQDCHRCGIIYGLNRPPKQPGICDECGQPLNQRDDDRDREIIRKRMDKYDEEIDVLLRYYEWKGILHRVDASAGDPDPTLQAVVQSISG